MNIAFILGTFPVTSETFVNRQIEALLAAGHSVTVIARQQGSSVNVVTAPNLNVIYSSNSETKKGET